MRFKMPLRSLAIDFPSDASGTAMKMSDCRALPSLSTCLAQPYMGTGKIN